MNNEMCVEFSSISENESFARVTIASFITPLNPTLDELNEIKTVVSEAVTNSIIHGYNNESHHKIAIECVIRDNEIDLTISDQGVGINNIEEAMEPLFTSKPELERSGMGFTIIENFMDSIEITSNPGEGTKLRMVKQLSKTKTVCK